MFIPRSVEDDEIFSILTTKLDFPESEAISYLEYASDLEIKRLIKKYSTNKGDKNEKGI